MFDFDLIQIFSTFGLGTLIGILIKSYLDRNLSEKKMLFEARIRAYSGITGRVFNLFLEPDITVLKEDVLIFAKLNQLLSESMLMASHELAQFLGDYKTTVYNFHVSLASKDEKQQEILHKQLVDLAGKIHLEMRKELFIDDKSIYSNFPRKKDIKA